MQRDMDLIRLLLLSYEGDQEALQKIEGTYLVMENGAEIVRYNRDLLFQAGYLALADTTTRIVAKGSASASVTGPGGKVLSSSHNESHGEAVSSTGTPLKLGPNDTGVFVAPRIPGLPPIQVPGGPTNLSEITEMRRREGRLTWEGHDFLDAARNGDTWHKAKDTLFKKGLSVSFDVLKAYLISEAKQHLGL